MATTQHVEIEAKYDLPEGAAVPDLLGVAAVARVHDLPVQVLTATYYDTADLALQRHRVTLRRRAGGSDDGWHLKLPVVGGERLEVRRPLGTRPVVPVALRRLLVTVAGDRRLVPVATLVTHRAVHHLVAADGQVLAELADDLVTVEREGTEMLRWRELEVELVEGDAAVLGELDKAVRKAGVQPSATSSKIGRVLSADSSEQPVSWTARLRAVTAAGALLAESEARLRVLDAMARAGRPGAPTDLEHGVRRRRVAEDLARRLGALGADDAAGRRGELAWAEAALAGAAGLDAAGRVVQESVGDQPADLVLGPVTRRLDREVAARRRSEQQSVAELLTSPRWLRLVAADGADLPAADGSGGPDGSAARGAAGGGRSPRGSAGGGRGSAGGGRGSAGRGRGPAGRDRGPRLGKALPVLSARAARRLERRLRGLDDATDRGLGERLSAARHAADAALLTVDLADRVGARRPAWAGRVTEIADLLDRLSTVVAALELTRAAGVAAHLAGENGFTFGRVHGLLGARAGQIARGLRAERKALRRARREA